MQRLLMVVLVMGFVHNVIAGPRHYYYRVSPADAPLKTEEAVYSPRPEYPLEAKQKHTTGRGLFAVHVRTDGRVERVTIIRALATPNSIKLRPSLFASGDFGQTASG